MKKEILRLSALSSRGQVGKDFSELKILITNLENTQSSSVADATKSSLLLGEWELIFADDDITRASPFFWAFRKATQDIKDPLDSSQKWSERVLQFTDSIPIKSIGECIQSITANENSSSGGILQSKVRVKVFPAGSSFMTTTSKWLPTADKGLLELQVEKTQVLESTIAKFLPFLDPDFGFPSGAALELVKPGSSTVYMRVTYLDKDMRISRNEEDGRVFVFTRKEQQ
eukprot:gene7216-14713_t